MTEKTQEKIEKRLKYFDENLDFLNQIKKIDWLVLEKQPHNLAAMMYYLYVLISSILDIGTHILASDFRENISHYREVLEKMAKHKIISEELFERNKEMPSFRNHLAHQYEEIDLKLVYGFVQNHFEDLKEFGEIFGKYAKNK